jgi:signal transduction histidine kinase
MTWFNSLSKIRTIEIVKYILFFGITFRALDNFANSQGLFTVVGLLTLFIVIYSLLPILNNRIAWATSVLLLILSGIIIILSFQEINDTPPRVDYFFVLFLLPIIFVGVTFSQQKAFWWDTVFSVLMIAFLIVSYGINHAFQFIILYLAIFLFVASYVAVLRKAEESDRESRKLLTELELAHHKLKQYALQAKEVAILEERNRLARELHDSVTQTIFSMTLTMDSVKILMVKDKDKVPPLIDRLRVLANDALAEMRTLITQLRPRAIGKEGLIKALQQHISERTKREGLDIDFNENVDAQVIIPEEVEENLFRVVQEALNNVVKHAQVRRASLSLRITGNEIFMKIEDKGIGFNSEKEVSDESHLGLIGIQERARKIDARVNINSKVGEGTSISLLKEIIHD